MVGTTIGHYKVTAKLGAGGMGEVYRATDTRLGRDVALKLLPADTAHDGAARARLVEEARSASALNHPHICHIYEVNEVGGITYFAMELADGEPLSRRIPPDGLPVETVVRFGEQIAAALAHAHERGILHRDLKSGNVMVTSAGKAKVLDFGLAQRLARDDLADVTRSNITQQQSGTIAGTLPYLAPEILSGQPASERSDVWSLGVLLHEMASGTMPFEGRTGYELTSAILREPPRPLERVPPALRAVVQRCLAKEPSQRYQKASEVHAALEVVGTTGRIEVTPPPARRARWMWGAAAGVAGIGLVLALARPWQAAPEVQSDAVPPPGGGPPATVSLIRYPSANREANELLQRAMMFTRFQADALRARPLLERALKLDPGFNEARVSYALTYIVAVESGASNDPGDIYRAEEELQRALREGPQLPRGRALMGAVHFFQGRTDLANENIRQAVQLAPRDLGSSMWQVIHGRFLGHSEEAIAAARQVIEVEPLFWPSRYHLGELLREQGKTAEAVSEQEKVLEQDPGNVLALRCLARAHLDAGDLQQARQVLERVRPQDRENFRVRMVWAQIHALEGRPEAAIQEMDEEVLKFADLQPFAALDAAEVYAILGQQEQAIEWIDRSMRKGDGRVDWLRRDPLLANVREHPRFKQIVSSMEFRRRQDAASPAPSQR